MSAFDRVDLIARTGRVRLVVLWKDSFVTWAVRCPDLFGRLTYYTQPNEQAAREFYENVIALLTRP
jgi:hypothetical protein